MSQQKLCVESRGSDDLATVVQLENVEFLRDDLARQEAEKISSGIDWDRLIKNHAPAQE